MLPMFSLHYMLFLCDLFNNMLCEEISSVIDKVGMKVM